MDSTKIMLLEKGELVEYEKPVKLLENPEGYFTKMVDATGPISAQYLRKIAHGEVDLLSSLDQPALIENIPVSPVEVKKETTEKKEKKEKKHKKHKKTKKTDVELELKESEKKDE
jgi:ABC-type proline/glycine betaine transport system ATPase subunit